MAIQVSKKRKVALVLSGGGIKAAAFHLGVCLALKQKGFHFRGGSRLQQAQAGHPSSGGIELYVGSSAGAFVTALLASGYELDAIIQAFRVGIFGATQKKPGTLPPLRYRDIFQLNGAGTKQLVPNFVPFWGKPSVISSLRLEGGLESMMKKRFHLNGFFTTRGLEKYLAEKALPFPQFQDLGVDLFVVGTQLNHSRKVLFGNFSENWKNENLMHIHNASIAQAVAASVALPPVFAPFPIRDPSGKEFYFYDGEIRDTLSTHVAADHGADLVISSSSIQPYHFTERIGSLHQFGIPVIINQALYQVIQQKIDRHVKGLATARSTYEAVQAYCKQNDIPKEHVEKILEILRQQLNFHPNVDYIDISPRPRDVDMFFADHFSLKPVVIEKIMKIGFKSALSRLREIT